MVDWFSPPEWVTELAADQSRDPPGTATPESNASLAASRNTSDLARRHEARLNLARDLRDILTDDSRSRREATFAAADLALAERKQLLADRHVNVSELPQSVVQQLQKQGIAADEQLTVSATPHLTAQQTKLRGARDLLQTAETDSTSGAHSLSKTTRLTETAFKVQVARHQTDTQPVNPSDVPLSTTPVPTPDHGTPVAATVAILEAQDTELTGAQAAELQALGALPLSTRQELTDVLDAYLIYYRTVEASNGRDVQRVRAAQLQLLDAAADLDAALNDSAPQDLVRPNVQIAGVVSIDLSRSHNTYTEDYMLQIDAGGHDTYNNNAGGANASGNATDVAALIDLGGSDTYNGRNGGGQYIVTEESPSPPDTNEEPLPPLFLPKQGEVAGFLLDAGTGDDTYNAESHASNGGGNRAIGLLVDAGGDDTYNGSGKGTNGAGYRKGTGFLLDAGLGADTYDAEGEGISNGGGGGGHGFLYDVGGNDTYRGSNGNGHLPVENTRHYPPQFCEVGGGIDTACQIYYFFAPTPYPPESGGFLVDGGGSDTYKGANGGANRRGSGFLLDVGTGDDTYDGKNGGANVRAAGFLLDMGGNDHYLSDRSSTRNGAGRIYGVGFLMDGGLGADTYNATTGGAPGARQRSQLGPGSLGANGGGWQGGHGFLVDAGGNDAYLAGSVGTNGGAISGDGDQPPALPNPKNPPTGFLLDAGGDDRYEVGHSGVNGGASGAIGLLYDNAGTDNYTERFQRCIDCSDIPKGAVGAQVDRGSGGENISRRTGSSEVLVVDNTTAGGAVDCPGAGYQAIQPAVDAAEPGDTVRVCAGTYPGNVTVETRNVRIEAAALGQVVLDGAHERRVGVALLAPQTTVIGVTATNVSIGFTALGRATTVRKTTSINSTRGILVAGLYSGGALQTLPVSAPLSDEKQPTVIADNTVTDAKQGITVAGTGNVRMTDNTVTGTHHGISVSRGTGVTIQNNTLSGQDVPRSKHQGGIASVRSWDITMTGNRVTGFTAPAQWQDKGAFRYGYGIQIRDNPGGRTPSYTLRNNQLADNRFNLMLKVPKTAYPHFTIAPSNTVNGKPVVYLVGAVGATIGPGGIRNLTLDSSLVPNTTLTNTQALGISDTPGYVACVRCIGVTVRNLDLSHNGHGVLVAKSRGVEVTNVTVHDTVQGISLQGSPTNTAVTNTTIRDTNIALNVAHTCDPRKKKFGQTYRAITRGTFELCAAPSVLLAHNTIRRSSKQAHRISGAGGAIMVKGPGVTVRENAISNVHGAAITVRGGRALTSGTGGILGIVPEISTQPHATMAVRDNTISDTRIGITMFNTKGTTVAANTISNAAIGLNTVRNNRVTYRANLVTNTTIGMFVHWAEVSLTARNNIFRDVRWGLDGRFLYAANPPHAPATHDFGTSNTVNSERILWLTGAVGRTIDATDANMVVCIRCVDVTIRDMTLTDNSHGIMLWDSTSTRVTNVRVTDTFRTGVLLRGGANNTVQNSTIIDSIRPIYSWPIQRESSPAFGPVNRQVGNLRENTTRALRETVGPVRIVNNRIAVDDARFPRAGMTRYSEPAVWGHYGILLFDTTEVTITGNNLTENQWGITVWGFRSPLFDIRIENNSITSPQTDTGFGRSGGFLYIWERTFGIRVEGRASNSSNSSLTLRKNTLTTSGTDGKGMVLDSKGPYPSTTVVNNRINGYKNGLIVRKRSNATSASVRRNRIVGAKKASVLVVGPPAAETVEIHQNLLNPLRFGHGVKYKMGGGGGGHMSSGGSGGSGGGHMAGGQQAVDATCNRWAAPNGPTSPRITLKDPVTGEPADGNGSAVSQGHMEGMSNVHFHPWLGNSPGRTCAKEVVGTATPSPTPGPTRTPWPTAEPGDGTGTGPGPGTGTGPGPGTGTGPGTGPRTATGGGEGTSTATARVAATATPTGTPPPTATPELVPGFGMGVWLVGFVLLVAVLAARRHD